MTKKSKLIGSASGMLVVAAFSGLLAGSEQCAGASTTKNISASRTAVVIGAGAKAIHMDGGTHDCKGKNDCKGQGGCKTSDNGCKGKNSCKGNGGCNTNATSQPSFAL